MEDFSTYSDQETKPLTLDNLKLVASKIVVGSTASGKRKGSIERLMNRFGWYRSSEWYFLRSDQFCYWPTLLKKQPEIKSPK